MIASTPHAGEVISGAQEVAAEHGSVLVVLDSRGDAGSEELQIRTLLSHRVDGFVYARMFHQDVEVPAGLAGARVVLANASTGRAGVSWVVPDEHGIGVTATQHLLDHGHRRIAFCTIGDAVPAAVGRERGYRERLGAAVDESLVVRTSADARGGARRGPPCSTGTTGRPRCSASTTRSPWGCTRPRRSGGCRCRGTCRSWGSTT
ncbi:hypothetical protein ACFQV2_25280 [Actinokineospora soli]|uniref:Periplasmic binding protein/LacI sugar binding domain-containing protein n=1 Tax=Actinokineospora soli TaxID=1048753 RepID=A0ABW2TT14_9PSEU